MHNGKHVKDQTTAASVIQDVTTYIQYIEEVRRKLAAKDTSA
jgi:hypothetical protein